MITHEQRDQIVAEARSWLRTPYHHMAMVKGAGVDCAHLIIGVYNTCGLLPLIEPDFYPVDWHLHRSADIYLNAICEHFEEIDESEISAGDLATFTFGRCVSHAGIVTEWPVIIHADGKHGVCSAFVNSGELAGRFYKCFRIKA